MSNRRKVTAEKQNQHRIRGCIEQAIFKEFLLCGQEHGFYGLGRQEMVRIAERAASAVMRERRIEAILKRRK